MTDLKLNFDYYAGGSLQVIGNDLATDEGLETAVLVSLFTDARAPDDLELPGETDRRGWWADALDQESEHGSLLWTLDRSKQTESVRARAEQYARAALAWLVDDLVAASVSVTAEFIRRGVLALSVQIRRPTGAEVAYRYNYVWQSIESQEG